MLNLRLSSIREQAHFCAVLLNVMLAHGLPTAMLLVRLSRALAAIRERVMSANLANPDGVE